MMNVYVCVVSRTIHIRHRTTVKSLYSLHMCMDAVVYRTHVSEYRDSWEIREICVLNRFSRRWRRRNNKKTEVFCPIHFIPFAKQDSIRSRIVFLWNLMSMGMKHVWNGVYVCCVLSARIRGEFEPRVIYETHTLAISVCIVGELSILGFSYNWNDMLSDGGAYIFAFIWIWCIFSSMVCFAIWPRYVFLQLLCLSLQLYYICNHCRFMRVGLNITARIRIQVHWRKLSYSGCCGSCYFACE